MDDQDEIQTMLLTIMYKLSNEDEVEKRKKRCRRGARSGARLVILGIITNIIPALCT